MSEYVYEVVDVSSDEMYYPMGIFLDEKAAVEAIKKLASNYPNSSMTEYDPDEFERVEVRKRKIGLNGDGIVVFELERKLEWNEETGEDKWDTVLCRNLMS